ncbi:hypothetical protein LX32DRAFT_218718 [Colletotrichum zoysiae]|uniref:Uncharacterized protein n=1 Tax=Colletotrichum zoysiae TaxID=1216348 RepID=A0AAD9HPR1_9PEZI|nr:hypothetical protein LX32DRAFT_218718 [Colletotrichum zoysiae]
MRPPQSGGPQRHTPSKNVLPGPGTLRSNIGRMATRIRVSVSSTRTGSCGVGAIEAASRGSTDLARDDGYLPRRARDTRALRPHEIVLPRLERDGSRFRESSMSEFQNAWMGWEKDHQAETGAPCDSGECVRLTPYGRSTPAKCIRAPQMVKV